MMFRTAAAKIAKAISCLFRRRKRASSSAPISKYNPTAVLESLERWSMLATGIILVGILCEMVAEVWFRHADESLCELSARLAASFLVGAGLAIEVFQISRAIVHTRAEKHAADKEVSAANSRVATARREAAEANERASLADERAAEANKLAEEANRDAKQAQLALETYREPRTLTPDQGEALAATLRAFVPMTFDVWLSVADREFFALTDLLGITAIWAGWEWVDPPSGVMHGQKMVSIGGAWLDVEIAFRFDAPDKVRDAANVFADGLTQAGIAANSRMLNVHVIGEGASRAAIHIRIGRKT
jgi:hypothetical protein